jgi:D-ribose pyranose/furanose isomerase RbsD
MSRLILASERIVRARALIQKARELPVPEELGRIDLHYVAGVRGLIQQARDLIKFIPYTPSASAEMKAEVAEIFKEADRAEKEILHPSA